MNKVFCSARLFLKKKIEIFSLVRLLILFNGYLVVHFDWNYLHTNRNVEMSTSGKLHVTQVEARRPTINLLHLYNSSPDLKVGLWSCDTNLQYKYWVSRAKANLNVEKMHLNYFTKLLAHKNIDTLFRILKITIYWSLRASFFMSL